MTEITCAECPWCATYDCPNARLVTCPGCGGDQLTYENIFVAEPIDPTPLEPAPVEGAEEVPAVATGPPSLLGRIFGG